MERVINLIIFLFLFIKSYAQNNPEQWFDTQYTDAIEYCTSNKILIDSLLSKCFLPTQMALSVAFPEMLRYTLWRDIFETKALELIYVRNGKSAADFSIGWLQMKPSFAELVEQKVKNNTLLNDKYSKLTDYNCSNTDIYKIREQRVERLKIFEWQLLYLSAFIDVNYKVLRKQNVKNRQMIVYLAAAYNRGMENDVELLSDFNKSKTFPYGTNRENPFGYAEVSEYFYYNNAIALFSDL